MLTSINAGVVVVAPVNASFPVDRFLLACVTAWVSVGCSVSVLSSTRLGAFLARWRAVDEGEGEPT